MALTDAGFIDRHMTGVGSLSGVKVPAKSPFSDIALAHDSVNDAHMKVVSLAVRLCGAQPCEAAAETKSPDNGLFDAAEAAADHIIRSARQIMNAVDRINARLP